MITKKCKQCNCELDVNNASKCGRNGRHLRNICKPCWSKIVVEYNRKNKERRKSYINSYVRKIGKVKEYSCESCQLPCIKKYSKAFCTDNCRLRYYIKIENNCWMYQGALNHRGYGRFSVKGNKNMTAHRASYLLFKGPIADGLFVCHTCDIPRCVNPNHLWLGTNKDNQQDSIKKGRQRWQKKKEKIDATTLFEM